MIGTTLGNERVNSLRHSISDEGIRYFDPTQSTGDLFVWEDGVHIVNEVKSSKEGIQYQLACGQVFTFAVPEDGYKPLEARLKLPTGPLCPKCMPLPDLR